MLASTQKRWEILAGRNGGFRRYGQWSVLSWVSNALAFINLSASGLLSILIGVLGMESLPRNTDDKASNNEREFFGLRRSLVGIHFSTNFRLSGLRRLSDTGGHESATSKAFPAPIRVVRPV
jgi:hypothetical protein